VEPTSFKDRPNPSKPFGGVDANIRSATWVEAKICLGHSIAILAAAASGGSAASLVRWWIHITSVLTDAVLVLVPTPEVWIQHPFRTEVYRHLVSASMLLTVVTFLRSGIAGRNGAVARS
jgi:hypothetical protein